MTYSEMAVRDEQMKTRTYCGRNYYVALQRAGARVILLPPVEGEQEMEALLGMLDGLVLPGGEDVDPRFQNEDPTPQLGIVNPWRDRYELQMARLAFARGLPTLGICRGIQVMAIALGGSVHQDVGTLASIGHSQNAPRWATSHLVRLAADSRLGAWLETESVYTNSFHHQAVNRMPERLRAVGCTGDGLVEALESRKKNVFVGVQWHPEELFDYEETARRLFRGFVKEVMEVRG